MFQASVFVVCQVLDLSYNSFSNLNPETLPRLSSLMLRGNVWSCDCELKPLRDYVIANKFFEPDLRCTEPLNLFNAQWDAFDQLSCKPEILHILANGKVVDSIVALESTLVLSCVVRGDPIPDVKWVKNGRVVQEAVGNILEFERIVMMNLTVGRNDNEFVCVGSNSGGVVERNLTVTVDEAGLSGFVVLKDGGLDGSGMGGHGGLGGGLLIGGERNGLVVYLVIGVVFLSLLVGLLVGGVCVWRWGKGGGGRVISAQDHDDTMVVKSAIKRVDEDEEDEDNNHDRSSSRGTGGCHDSDLQKLDESTRLENEQRMGLYHHHHHHHGSSIRHHNYGPEQVSLLLYQACFLVCSVEYPHGYVFLCCRFLLINCCN